MKFWEEVRHEPYSSCWCRPRMIDTGRCIEVVHHDVAAQQVMSRYHLGLGEEISWADNTGGLPFFHLLKGEVL